MEEFREALEKMYKGHKAVGLHLILGPILENMDTFDGSNIPLRDFVQDLKCGAALIEPFDENQYLHAVLRKLKGPAKVAVSYRDVKSLDELITILKNRFLPYHDYSFCIYKILSLQRKQNEDAATFHDRLNIIMCDAQDCLEDLTVQNDEKENESLTEEQIKEIMVAIQELVNYRKYTSMDQLVRILEKNIGKNHNYSYCVKKILCESMKKDETVISFCQRFKILIQELKDIIKHLEIKNDEGIIVKLTSDQKSLMKIPLKQVAVDTLLKKIPADIALSVANSITLEDACERAVQCEVWMKHRNNSGMERY